jgi:hypothetical protein
MDVHWKPLLSFLALAAFVGANAQLAHTEPPIIESLDAQVTYGWLVIVGRAVKVEEGRVTFAVEETLKGEKSAQILLDTRWEHADKIPGWIQNKNRLLVSAGQGMVRIVDLSAKDLAVMRSDLTVLRNPGEILAESRKIADRSRGKYVADWFDISASVGKVIGTSLYNQRYGALDFVRVHVPIDEALLKWALKAVKADEVQTRNAGAVALQFFRSDKTEAILKALQSDPGYVMWETTRDNKIYGRKEYLARVAAYQVLDLKWKLPLEKTVLSVPDYGAEWQTPEAVVGMKADGRVLADADLEEIARYPNLEDLDLARAKLSPTTGEALAKHPSLRVLYLTASNVQDADLEKLAASRTLEYLDLRGTEVTDKGLAALAGMKALKKVDLGVKVTAKGIEALRKSRPRLIVREDPMAFLEAFQPRRVEMRPNPVTSYPTGNRDAMSMHGYVLMFKESQRQAVEEALAKELPKRGWVREDPGYFKPGPPELKRRPWYMDDHVFLPGRRAAPVEVRPGDFGLTVFVNTLPR